MNDPADPFAFDETASFLPPQPYPGLRPFTKNEWQIFFGRESMTQDVVSRLLHKQFVAVHGDSGCGKSSLIAAGVMPLLEHDQARAGGRWTTCIMRPQDAPMMNLARALAGGEGVSDASKVLDIRRLLNRADAAVAVARHLGCDEETNVCILFDQFEELFEHERRGGSDAKLLTAFLVGLVAERPKGLHAVLTMRSDYLGQCAQYRGFAETVNETQYLVPRMERPALMRAIREPAELFGGSVEPELASRLIADAGMGQDQLPLIQHGLMLMWRKGVIAAGGPPKLALQDYSAGGDLSSQLSRHADDIMAEAAGGAAGEMLVEKIFRALTDRNPEGLAIRRRQTVGQLLAVTGGDRADLLRILDRFRADDASFLRPFGTGALNDEDEIDISHEAFIRNWKRISEPGVGWLDREADDGLIWTSLRISAAAFKKNPEALLSNAAALERERWAGGRNEAWAERHGGHWQDVSDLIAASVRAARAAMFRRRLITFGAIAAAVVFAAVAVFAGWQTTLAKDRQLAADEAASRASESLNLAVSSLSLVASLNGATDDAVKLAVAGWPRQGDDTMRPRISTVNNLAKAFGAFRVRLKLAHPQAVNSARFSPDGKWLLTGGSDGMVRLWDSVSGEQKDQFLAVGAINGVAFSPDGKTIAATSSSGTVFVWDLEKKAPPRGLTECKGPVTASGQAASGQVSAVAFSPKEPLLAAGCEDGVVRIWDFRQGSVVRRLEGHAKAVWAVAYSPDGKRLATGSDDMTARIWTLSENPQWIELKGHTDSVWAVAFSPDGTLVATGSKDTTARIWKSDGTLQATLTGHSNAITGIAFSPAGDRVATGSWDTTARIWAVDGRLTMTLTGHSWSLISVDYAPDARLVTTSSDKTARIWEVQAKPPMLELSGHTDQVWGVAFSPNDRTIATASNDKTVRLWDMLTGVEFARLNDHSAEVWSVAFSPDGEMLATGSYDHTVRLWDIRTRQMVKLLGDHTDAVTRVVFSPDGKQLATGSWDKTIILWDTAKWEKQATLSTTGSVIALAYSSDGSRLVAGLGDGTSSVWDVATRQVSMTLDDSGGTGGMAVNGAAISPDGNLAVTASGVRASVRSLKFGTGMFFLTGHSDTINDVAFSHRGTRIATAAVDGTVRVWDAATGAELATFGGSEGAMTRLAFSPDDSRLAVGGDDGKVRIWDLSTLERGSAFDVACLRLGANTDLTEVSAQYGLPQLTPICGDHKPLPVEESLWASPN